MFSYRFPDGYVWYLYEYICTNTNIYVHRYSSTQKHGNHRFEDIIIFSATLIIYQKVSFLLLQKHSNQ